MHMQLPFMPPAFLAVYHRKTEVLRAILDVHPELVNRPVDSRHLASMHAAFYLSVSACLCIHAYDHVHMCIYRRIYQHVCILVLPVCVYLSII